MRRHRTLARPWTISSTSCKGLGLAAAIGIRPFLPTLLAGALATANLGLDFDDTAFSFLESTGFLFAMLVLVFLVGILERRRLTQPVMMILLASSLVLGALLAAGSLDDNSDVWWPGVPIGVAAASLGFLAARSLFERVRARLDDEAAGRAAAVRRGRGAARRGALDPLPTAGRAGRRGTRVAAAREPPAPGREVRGPADPPVKGEASPCGLVSVSR